MMIFYRLPCSRYWAVCLDKYIFMIKLLVSFKKNASPLSWACPELGPAEVLSDTKHPVMLSEGIYADLWQLTPWISRIPWSWHTILTYEVLRHLHWLMMSRNSLFMINFSRHLWVGKRWINFPWKFLTFFYWKPKLWSFFLKSNKTFLFESSKFWQCNWKESSLYSLLLSPSF